MPSTLEHPPHLPSLPPKEDVNSEVLQRGVEAIDAHDIEVWKGYFSFLAAVDEEYRNHEQAEHGLGKESPGERDAIEVLKKELSTFTETEQVELLGLINNWEINHPERKERGIL